MLNLGTGELLVIALVALVVLGPTRLPGAARQAGAALGELRRMSSSFQDEIGQAMREPDLPELTAPNTPALPRRTEPLRAARRD